MAKKALIRVANIIGNLEKQGALESDEAKRLSAGVKRLGHAVSIGNRRKIEKEIDRISRMLLVRP